jgi:hypothetical protein
MVKIGIVVAILGGVASSPQARQQIAEWKRALWHGAETVTGKATVERGQMAAQILLRRRLELAGREYRSLNGQAPETLDALVGAGLLQSGDLTDEWGRALTAESGERGMRVRSAGPDGHFHTGDDWTLDV